MNPPPGADAADTADTSDTADTVYRLAPAHLLRLFGPVAVVLGVAWVGCALTGMARAWVVGAGVVSIAAAIAGAYLFVRPPRVLTLTADGYRIGLVRGAGRAGGPWKSVESVGTAETAAGAALVFRLADGDRSAVPLSLLGRSSVEAQREVHERLNRAYGYRRL